MENMYSKTARYYDKLYASKDYVGEVQRLISLLGVESDQKQLTLLDVACGTGLHIEHLRRHFHVEGLDICPELLEVARERNPDTLFHLGDMIEFNLGKQFDVITCLFSSIGYVKTLDKLRSAVRSMAAHLKQGGMLVIEPWFTSENWHPNTVHALYIDEPELKIARINTSFVKDRVSVFDLHHLVGTPEGTEHFVEHHELGLFAVEETISVMEEAGLAVKYDPDGLTGRGLYIGKRKGLPNKPDAGDGK
ncbi:MAG: class I SAM-dependent methyltransferase [Coprothermobacterota bacterium]|nr:class I SAM-dependent methyltransferase [Coprothermobacterota bacterium]